jgi:hypothetical protein
VVQRQSKAATIGNHNAAAGILSFAGLIESYFKCRPQREALELAASRCVHDSQV